MSDKIDSNVLAKAEATVVVPVHGKWDVVLPCIESLLRQTTPCQLIVVDDASPDDVATQISARFPEVEVVQSATNVGFGAACNLGIRRSAGQFVILVNSDIVAEPGFVGALLSQFTDSTVGSATAVLQRLDGAIDAAGVTIDRTLAGFVRYHGARHIAAYGPKLGCAYGASAAYRRSALDETGLFDENLFMYGEELELGLRLLSAGWRSTLATGARATHVGAATIGAGSSRQRYLSGFARGYTLRVYDVLRSRALARAVVTETAVVLAQIGSRHGIAGMRGRVDGWRAARGVPKRRRPRHGIDLTITTRQSLKMRRPSYWAHSRASWDR